MHNYSDNICKDDQTKQKFVQNICLLNVKTLSSIPAMKGKKTYYFKFCQQANKHKKIYHENNKQSKLGKKEQEKTNPYT